MLGLASGVKQISAFLDTNMLVYLKPIFDCDAKPFALGTGVDLATLSRHLKQKTPTC